MPSATRSAAGSLSLAFRSNLSRSPDQRPPVTGLFFPFSVPYFWDSPLQALVDFRVKTSAFSGLVLHASLA